MSGEQNACKPLTILFRAFGCRPSADLSHVLPKLPIPLTALGSPRWPGHLDRSQPPARSGHRGLSRLSKPQGAATVLSSSLGDIFDMFPIYRLHIIIQSSLNEHHDKNTAIPADWSQNRDHHRGLPVSECVSGTSEGGLASGLWSGCRPFPGGHEGAGLGGAPMPLALGLGGTQAPWPCWADSRPEQARWGCYLPGDTARAGPRGSSSSAWLTPVFGS